ncbi:MAG: hypothetical protein GF308_22150 [Candidatus Heimdallarchaeota archaeon]|nr:hypothetical protein [Candidatus Heimdallarchaeota archaeon]
MKNEEVKQTLIQALEKDEYWVVRREAAKVIEWLKIEEAIPTLTKVMKEDLDKVRKRAIFTLMNFEEKAATAISELIEILQHDENYAMRMAAAMVLTRIGEKAEETIPDLISMIKKDKDLVVREAAVWVLRAIGSTEAIKTLEGRNEERKK